MVADADRLGVCWRNRRVVGRITIWNNNNNKKSKEVSDKKNNGITFA